MSSGPLVSTGDPEPATRPPGAVLADWLRRRAGEPLNGRAWSLADPLNRGSRFVEEPAGEPFIVIGEPRAGGQAAVARAVVAGIEQPLAARMIFASTDPRAQQRERVQVAAGQMSLSHPDYVPALVRSYRSLHMTVPVAELYGHEPDDDQPGSRTVDLWGQLLEWCPRTLADELEARAGLGLDLEGTVRRFLPVMQTLVSMHGLGYVHRDLDPSNILVAEDGALRLADFGIAVHMNTDHTSTMTEAWGKPGRMPPEAQHGAQVPVGPAYDAWQVGFVLAEAVLGARPVLAGGGLSPRLADLPKPVRAVLRDLLEPDRDRRLAVAEAADRLRGWLDSLHPVIAPVPAVVARAAGAAPAGSGVVGPAVVGSALTGPASSLIERVRRRRVPLVVVGAAAVVGVAVLLGAAGPPLDGLTGAQGATGTTGATATTGPTGTTGATGASRPAPVAGLPKAGSTTQPQDSRVSGIVKGVGAFPRSLAFGSGGRLLAVASDSPQVMLVDTSDPTDPKRLARFDAKGDWTAALALSPDGRTLATSGNNGTIRIWDLTNPRRPRLRQTLPLTTMYVPDLAFSPDGRTLASAGYDDKVKLWAVGPQTVTLRQVLRARTRDIMAVAFDSTGRRLAAASYDEVTLWDLEPGRPPRAVAQVPASSQGLIDVAFGADRRTLAVADGTVTLWDVSDYAQPRRIGELAGAGESVAWSATDARVATLDDDTGRVTLWDLTAPARPAVLTTYSGAEGDRADSRGLIFSDDGRLLAASRGDGGAALVRLDPVRNAG